MYPNIFDRALVLKFLNGLLKNVHPKCHTIPKTS